MKRTPFEPYIYINIFSSSHKNNNEMETDLLLLPDSLIGTIREIPDHATMRGKGAITAWLDKLGLSPSLTLRN